MCWRPQAAPPTWGGIGLDQTKLKLDDKALPSFDPLTTRTVNLDGLSPVFIAGDASNFIPLLHEAADEGRIAGWNAARLALGQPVVPGLRSAPLGVVFTDPQIAIVGSGFHKRTIWGVFKQTSALVIVQPT